MAYRTEIEKLEQRHAENPKQWFAALADAYRKQGDVDLAIEYVKSGLEERPDYASAHIVLGRCYLDKEMDGEASAAFEQVLELDGENIIALKSLADISERQGDNASARRWLSRLLEVDPMNEEALECLERMGPEEEIVEAPVEEQVEADEVAEMALELGADDPAAEEAEPIGLEPTVSEEAIDASALEVSPMMLDATMPMDAEAEEPPVSIEPIDIELPQDDDDAAAAIEPIEAPSMFTDEGSEPLEIITEESDPISLIAATSDEDETDDVLGGSSAAIEPLELESADDGASALLAGMSDLDEPEDEDETITAEIEPIELESADDHASSLVSDDFGEPEPDVMVETTMPEFEAVDVGGAAGEGEEGEVEAGASADATAGAEVAEEEDGEGAEEGADEVEEPAFRESVPPTKEVAAVELESMREADELVARPTLDAEMVHEEDAEAPIEDYLEDDVGEEIPEAEEAFESALEDDLVAAEETIEDVADEAPVDVDEIVEAEPEMAPKEIPQTTEIDVEEIERLRQLDAVEVERVEEDVEGFAESVAVAEEVVVDEDEATEEPAEEEALPLIMPEDAAAETADGAEPEPVVTETMAEVYAKQGMYTQAREIYEVLAMQHPDDTRLQARLDELNEQSTSALQETRQSRFSVAATGGDSAVAYLQNLFSSGAGAVTYAPAVAPEETVEEELEEAPEPDVDPEPTPLEQAFMDDPPPAPGEPTMPAADEVKLASVFDGDATERPSTETPVDTENGVSYDEFYGSDASGASSDANGLPTDDDSSDDDDDNFKDWLKGLKT